MAAADRTIVITGRDPSEKKTVPFSGSLQGRTDAVLTVLSKALGERPAYLIDQLVAKVKLTAEQEAAVETLLKPSSSLTPAAPPQKHQEGWQPEPKRAVAERGTKTGTATGSTVSAGG